jgi:lysophospholipase L1-like esterase
MNIREKVLLDVEGLRREGPVTVVAFGDSVTHGAVAAGEMDYDSVYWNRFRLMIQERYPYMPVNVINAGIGGDSAPRALGRMEDQVLRHRPDLVIVCFGLNDVHRALADYLGGLRTIFEACRDTDVIFMTPNMLNTYVAEDTAEAYKNYAYRTAKMQNEGVFDKYIYSAVELAKSMGITVCDCYSKWKKLSETEDITLLLANRINHPNRKMHELFANELFKIIFDEEQNTKESDSGMCAESKR